MSTFSKKSKTNKFSFYGFCAGHRGPVECLAVIEDGSLLASGGADGTRVWNLDTTRELQRPGGAGSRGATIEGRTGYRILRYPKWLPRRLEAHKQQWIQPLFSVTIGNFVLKAIAFGDYKNTDREIMVFGLDDGNIHTLRGADGVIVKTRGVGGQDVSPYTDSMTSIELAPSISKSPNQNPDRVRSTVLAARSGELSGPKQNHDLEEYSKQENMSRADVYKK
ncbi:hypothetical protein B0H14DRAFT_2610081 [Mycena olivaceomarginata]|nr:hypothetical protein B0H14DRAFT_2610081 [Mycena olivaceomarginata]